MSFSFSVTEKSPEDARREFGNKLTEHEHFMPNSVLNTLGNSAQGLIYHGKSNQVCTLSADGHFNPDGSGACRVSCIISPPQERKPDNVSEHEIAPPHGFTIDPDAVVLKPEDDAGPVVAGDADGPFPL